MAVGLMAVAGCASAPAGAQPASAPAADTAPTAAPATARAPAAGPATAIAPAGASATAPAPVARVPFRLIDNRIFIDAHINGRGSYAFVLDTGGAYVVDRDLAVHLALPRGASFTTGGAGPGQATGFQTHLASLTLGSLHLPDLPARAVPLARIRDAIGFRRFDGIVGAELLRRYVTVVDYRRHEVRFYRPDQPIADAADAAGTALPITFLDSLPLVAAHLDGLAGRFLIDTGDRSALTLNRPFVARHHLIQRYRAALQAITGCGVGGPIPARVTRTGALRLGPITLRNLVTRMPTSTTGIFAADVFDGSIGNGALAGRTLVIDYPHRRLVLGRAAGPPAGATTYDRAGMWLQRRAGGELEIIDVVADSPAARAHLRAGDRVLAVDGRAAAHIDLIELRRRLAAPERRAVALEVAAAAGAQPRAVVLSLRDLLPPAVHRDHAAG